MVTTAPFRYHRPLDRDAALAVLAGDACAVLAGGTDFVTMRAEGRLASAHVVDVKGIADLQGVDRGEVIWIGGATPMAEVASCPDPELAALIDGAGLVGSAQTRNRATLGGNVCRSSPAGDTLPALLVLGAQVLISSTSGARALAVAQFFTGPGSNCLAPGELVTGFEVPLRSGGSAYRRLTYRAWMDLAVMGVAVHLSLDDGVCARAAVALGGVAPTPLLVPAAGDALVGTSLAETDLARAVDAAVAAADPIDDVRGTRAYRIQGIRALLPRTVRRARERAEGGA